MAMYKPAFKELAAALAEEVASVGRGPLHQADCGLQPVHSIATSRAEHDPFGPMVGETFQDESEVFIEHWLEMQLLDCQNLARRHGFGELSRILDEALDALIDERRLSGSPADWQNRSQQ